MSWSGQCGEGGESAGLWSVVAGCPGVGSAGRGGSQLVCGVLWQGVLEWAVRGELAGLWSAVAGCPGVGSAGGVSRSVECCGRVSWSGQCGGS